MKLINSVGPNPHVVRMFAAERGIKLAMETLDIMAGANRQADYLRKNPAGQSPCLELDDGSYLSEVTAICEYLDEKAPGASLIGATPEQRAETRMWTRRVDLNVCEPLANGFRFAEGLPLFKDRILTVPEAADGLKRIAQDRLKWLDGQLAGKQFLCGDRISLADVLLYCFLAFGNNVGQPVNPANANVKAWFDRMAARPSASA
jgi:glutathione S-transferase